jgi:hypothetical protein
MTIGVQPRKRDWQPMTGGRFGWTSTDGHRIHWVQFGPRVAGFYLDDETLLDGTNTRDDAVEAANAILDGKVAA